MAAGPRSSLVIVKPETVIAWHGKGFRLFWSWKVRRGQLGRPPVPKDVRELIRKMCRDNPLWGAPRIHGELRKLGIDIGGTTRRNLGLCTRRTSARSLRYLKLAGFTTATSGAQPNRNSPRHDSYAGCVCRLWLPGTSKTCS